MRAPREARYPYGFGVARRALGQVALALGDAAGAEAELAKAFEPFGAIEARREVGSTRLCMAAAAHTAGRLAAAAASLRDASILLARLPGARLANRAAALAGSLGVSRQSPELPDGDRVAPACSLT